MNKIFRPLLLITLFLTVFFLVACSKNTENEHLPEYCQTYAGFTSIASKDFYDLLRDQSDIDVNRTEYIEAISQISLEFIVDDPNREIDLSGIQCFQNLTDLTLVGLSFKDLSPISALSNIQSIELRGTSVVSIDSFKNLSKIKSLKISETRTLQSVAGVEEMTKLTDLDLSSNGIVVIDGLNNLVNLKTLYLNDNEIVSFPSINQLEFLTNLDISDNNINKLGEDLSGLRNLTELNAKNNEICDLSTLDDLTSLVILNLSNNNLGCGGAGVSPNFDSLENAPNLEELYLDNNNLTSIEGLRNRDINLEVLHLNDNNLTDITPIGEYTDIIELVLFNNNITDIDDLSGMTGLTSIDISNNNITDFSDLLSIPNLIDINLAFNNITTIPDISASWTSLSSLDLSSNYLTDTSGVSGHPTIESLIIYNNGLHELSGISDLPELDNLVIFDELLELELEPIDVNPNDIQIIRDSFNNLESLDLQDDNVFDFGFELGSNVEIYNSINGLTDIQTIVFTDMDIDVIDVLSINLPNLRELYVDENNISDISFILGNPLLERLYINNNTISNLDIISGVLTSDLDNLEHVVANDITADNHLLDSFIQLPNLSTIDLTNTSIVSISNSFNDLSSLTAVNIDADNLLTIENSFNDIFDTYDTLNRFVFTVGKIGVISGSFNGGIYDRIGIVNQVTTETTTVIEDSFNNLEIRDVQGIIIENSSFSTISNSFNNIDTDILSLSTNEVESITDSFVDSTINSTIDLSENLIEDIPSLNQLTYVEQINLNTNHLNTVSFIDGIVGLETLDISIQRNVNTASYTLSGIDGINNMPTLTTLYIGDIGITSIDGFRNIGITSFEFSKSNNNNISIASVSPTSFIGTPLVTLDLDSYELNNIAFLDNLDVLESLYIGIDLADLSDFQGQNFQTTLEVLAILNAQNTLDLGYLSDYDVVTNLTFSSPLTTVINNLNGMDGLLSLALDFDQITEINSSFNVLPDFNLNNVYLEQFTVLDTISNSFDIYGDPDHSGMVNLSAAIEVYNSFNNTDILNVEGNDGDLIPNFDTLSFDNIGTMNFDFGSYSSFSFLNGYTNLNEVMFSELDASIIDLANDNIELLSVLSADTILDTFILDLNSEAEFELTSLRNGQISISGDFANYDLNATNANIVLNSTALTQTLQADIDNMILNADLVSEITLNNYTSTSTTLNTDALTNINRNTTLETNALLLTINTLEANLDISAKVGNVVINDNNATNYILDISGGAITLNNSVPDITVEANGTDLEINYNTLENITLAGNVDTVNVTSTLLENIDASSTITTIMNVDSNQAVMTVLGNNIDTLNITNDSINDLTALVGVGDLTLTSTNNELLNTNISGDQVQLLANNIPSIVITDTTAINALDLTNSNALNTLTYGTASINNIELTTSETALTVTGSASSITLTGSSLSSLNVDSPLSNVVVLDSADVLSVELDINSLQFNNTTLTTLNMVALSSVINLTIDNSSNFETLNSNDSFISSLSVTSDVSILNIDATESVISTIEGALFTSITADFGTNDVTIDSTNTAPLNMEIVADQLFMDTATTELVFDNASALTSLQLSGNGLANLNAGTAIIGILDISISSGDLDILGTGLTTISIGNHGISALDVTASLTTDLHINSTSVTGINVTTNTSDMNLVASGDSTVISSTLENITFNLGTNDLDFTVNKTNLDFTIDGTAELVTISGGDVDSIITTANTAIGTLGLNNIDVDVLDFTTGVVNELDITTLLTSINITGDEVESVIIDGINLTTVDVTSNSPISDLVLTTSQTTLDLNTNVLTIDLTNNNLTILDLAGVTTNILTLQANNLSSLNTANNVTDSIHITTSQNIFDLNTSATSIGFTGSISGTLDLTNTSTLLTVLETNTDILELNSSSTSLNIDGANLSQINGTIDAANISDTTDILTFDLSATGTLVINNDTVDELIFNGINTIDVLDINSISADTVNTNSVDINLLKYEAADNDTLVTTETDVIELSTSINAIVTLDYMGTTALNLQTEVTNWVIINIDSATTLDVEGEATTITITGVNLSTVATDLLTVYSKLTMNNTTITDLDFISTDVLVNIDTIEINSLSNTNIDSIMAIIDNSFIDLISPITALDVYNYYYNGQITILEDQEAIDTLRYDDFRDTAINDAWTLIAANQYMDYLDETLTKANEIDAQTYQTAEQYFAGYLVAAALTEGDFTPTERQGVIDAIQATIDDPLLTISIPVLNSQVTASIEVEATTYATTEQANDTFTLS